MMAAKSRMPCYLLLRDNSPAREARFHDDCLKQNEIFSSSHSPNKKVKEREREMIRTVFNATVY